MISLLLFNVLSTAAQPLITGFVAPTFTPFNASGMFAPEQVPAMAEFVNTTGLSWVYLCGSTGESVDLTTSERKAVVEAWMKPDAAPKYSIRVIVHVGSDSVITARDLAQHAEENGAAAVASMAPTYIRPTTTASLLSTMSFIAGGAPSLPFYYYHIPSKTGITVKAADFLAEAGKASVVFPNLAGVKFTDYAVDDFLLCTTLARPPSKHNPAEVYNMLYGMDGAVLGGLAVGADGGVGTSYNWNARVFMHVKEALERNDLAAARHAQSATNELMASLKAAEVTSPSSYVWKIFYNIVTPDALQAGEGRLPYLPPTPGGTGIAAKLKEAGKTWCKKYAKETFVPHWCATMI
jgi:N-acetylneuraminate lyase